MSKLKLNSKELRKIGFPETPVMSQTLNLMHQHFKFWKKPAAMELLQALLARPGEFMEDDVLAPVARQLIQAPEKEPPTIKLLTKGVGVELFGQNLIAEGAIHQICQAAKLPVSVAGALMPDAHSGYGLPIGGVLATRDAVIPYGVGVDIGCRIVLSIFSIPPLELDRKSDFYARILEASTLFGSGAGFATQRAEHAVLEHDLFGQLPLLKSLQGTAWRQLGTSGSGNHFAEFGVVHIAQEDPVLAVPAGDYIGLMTHSGSRALGAAVANHYTKLAIAGRRLEGRASHLAWLSMCEDAGKEYWEAMTLAGAYAAACHEVIHDKISRALRVRPLRRIANFHNFAWREHFRGQEVIVHRKGATPAGKDVLGIIAGSMATDAYIVKGRGEATALNSAAHGAGRKMSRSAAVQSLSVKQLRESLQASRVRLLGGGLDESPYAYKDIHKVMDAQMALVESIGLFQPRIVKMDGSSRHSWKGWSACS